MKTLKFAAVLVATACFLSLESNAQIYTPDGTIQGSSGSNSVGIGTATPSTSNSVQVNRTGTGTYSRAFAAYVTPQNTAPCGFYSYVYSPTPMSSGRTYGVAAEVGNATSGWNYAIYGRLFGSNNGAAIIGIVPGRDVENVGGMWAGYFRGNVYVESNLGIGTKSPTDAFQIGTNTTFNSASASLTGDVRLPGYSSSTPYAFIGARDNSGSNSIGVVLRSQNAGSIVNAIHIMPNGNVGVGTTGTTTTEKFIVNGRIKCEELIIENVAADYVFNPDYKLLSLSEVETFIKENGHLPDVAPACETEQGIKVSEFNTVLLQKIEELTLYMIELKKENTELRAMIEKN
jgi:hypothetical protein